MTTNNHHPAIVVAADSAEKLRPCDAWRVYDEAEFMGMDDLNTVKATIKEANPKAYLAMQEYEVEMMSV
jgi:hypothetical protein